ncbi:MAG: RHS repeat-associated core domain-containing protein, partial [Betaproteobacteria bacterium]|nr:RHS repeat-associated core domain-containing protein [Betaproteobacteria bacterium]
ARYYDPDTARFTQRDPIGLQGGMNLYAYVGNNPVNFIDPTGMLPKVVADKSSYPDTGANVDWDLVAEICGSACAGSGGLDMSQGTQVAFFPGAILGGGGSSVLGAGGALSGSNGKGSKSKDDDPLGDYRSGGSGGGFDPCKDLGIFCNSENGGSGQQSGTYASNEVKSYSSYPSFRYWNGSAGSNMEWHHIVEQNSTNIQQFGQNAIQNTTNIIRLDTSTHRAISAYYSTAYDFSGGVPVRQWLSNQSFEAQQQFGLQTLRNFGVNVPPFPAP